MNPLDTFNSRGGGLLSSLALVAVMSTSVALAQPAAAAAPRWGAFKTDKCMAPGIVQKSSILYGIQGSWEDACYHAGAEIDGLWYAHPNRCVNTGLAMWGEFDVPAIGCRPSWGPLRKDHCISVGTRQYSASLDNIKDNINWDDACMNMPNEVAGLTFGQPMRCRNEGSETWGEWEVPDESCATP